MNVSVALRTDCTGWSMLASFVAAGLIGQASLGSGCEDQWLPTLGGQPGVNTTVRTMVVFDDGTGDGEALILGGAFTSAGGIEANRIVKWSGRAQTWTSLGSGMNDYVEAIAVFDDGAGPALYAGGSFTMAGGVKANCIAKWDGESWSPLGSGITGGPGSVYVYALAVFDDGSGDALYAGGIFSAAGGAPALNIANWNGANWSPVGSGISLSARALAVFDDGSGEGPALYAGGSYSIRKWNGTAWLSVGGSVDGHISALCVFDDGVGAGPALFAGGGFTRIGNVLANHIARWSGNSWSPLGEGMGSEGNPWVNSLVVFDDRMGEGPALTAGGYLASAGGQPANRVAKWDGRVWSPLGGGAVGAGVDALAVFDEGNGPALFAAGDVTTAVGSAANRVSRWDGLNWSSLGHGVSAPVRALAVLETSDLTNSRLIVGGEFLGVAGAATPGVAQWDGKNWTSLGSGVNGRVRAIVVDSQASAPSLEPLVYVAGDFLTAGDVEVRNVALWDGNEWSSLGTGIDTTIEALALYDEGQGAGQSLFVGGKITHIDGEPIFGVARWDGMRWTSVGSGLNGHVRAFAVFDDGLGDGPSLYAGGSFTHAGSAEVNALAKWNGLTWSALGSGLNGSVRSLTVHDDGLGGGPALYVGGSFGMAGGTTALRIAKWNGTEWSSVGDGLDGAVTALTPFPMSPGQTDQSLLFAGGSFRFAGSANLMHLAKWDGRAWVPYDEGLNQLVSSMQVFRDPASGNASLVIGGFFTSSPARDSFLARLQPCVRGSGTPGDIDGDGRIGGKDLQFLLSAWGQCSTPCAADLNGDGVVNIDDLLIVINHWS